MDGPLGTARLSARAAAALVAVAMASGARFSSPLRAAAIGRAEIEADWIRQFELRDRTPPAGAAVRPEDDAAGGCDGRKDGTWGFHTEDEERPWWQVDLGEVRELDRLVLYNRTDACAERAARIAVLLSEDGASFRRVYQHDGTTFFGHAGGDPLTVRLGGARARWVRLQLPGKSYFHLDEVEAYAVGDAENIALDRPATQKSVSRWSVRHAAVAGRGWGDAAAKAIERGLRLAANLRDLGADVDAEVESLRGLAAGLGAIPSGRGLDPAGAAGGEGGGRRLYLEARRAVRALALKNPLLDFDAILFAKAAPGRFPHISDQFYGWWSRPGGGIYILEGFRKAEPELRCLTAGMPEGSWLRPELSWDGKKVLFAYCRFYPHVPDLPDKAEKSNLPEDAFYHIFEMGLDGTNLRQLTRGRYDDFDARYLPNGEIVFLSTRKGRSVQVARSGAEAAAASDLPDSYVRCGGDCYRPVPVFTLHAMDADGGGLRPLSAFENFEWSPCVANDGRILYTRWDYIDRFNGHFFSLWAARPDGSNPELVYGNYTVRPQAVLEARPIPGSTRLLCVASAHHSITGGSIVRLDRGRGTEGEAPIDRLTPDVPFPETEGWPAHYYAGPYPLSEEHFLVSWSDRPLPPHCRVDASETNPPNASGIYLADAFGNLELLYRDPEISSTGPVPVRP
ncbi:MAG: discoidin domain-containing protein, partial [Planctomycetota bacterium]